MSKFTDRRRIRKRIPKTPTAYPATLGDGNGVVLTGRDNYHYAIVGTQVETVYNDRIPPDYGTAVTVGHYSQDPQRIAKYRVLETRTTLPNGANPVTSISLGQHGARHRFLASDGGQDVVWIEGRQYLPMGVYAYSGLTCYVMPGPYWDGDVFAWYAGGTVDLSAYEPATAGKAVLVVICLTTHGAIATAAGDEFDTETVTAVADVLAEQPELPNDTGRVLALVRIYNGQVTPLEARTGTDIYDLRDAGANFGGQAIPQMIYGKNESGGNITRGQAVSITAAAGQWTAFTKTNATTAAGAYAFVGLAQEAAAANDFFHVIIGGEISNLNTSSLTEGSAVYVNPASAGNLTATYPAASNYIVNVGVCERAHATQGRIQIVRLIQPKLSDLSDVSRTLSPSAGDLIKWDGTKWITIASGSVGISDHSLLSNLTYAAAGHTGFAGTGVANTFTAAQKINVNSTTALLVEQDGVKDNVFVVDTTNARVGVNIASPVYDLHIYGDETRLRIQSNSLNTATHPAYLDFHRSNGTVLNGAEEIGVAVFSAQQNAGVVNAALLTVKGEGAGSWGTGANRKAFMSFATTNGVAGPEERMRISGAGLVTVGSAGGGLGRFNVLGYSDIVQEIIKAHSSQTAALVQHQDSSTNVHNQFSVTAGVSNVINEQGADIDTRIESDGLTHAVFVDASTNRVAFNDSAPLVPVEVSGSSVGHSGFWSGTAIDGTAQTIIANATGDVTKVITLQYVSAEITGTDVSGGVVSLEPGDTHTVLVDAPAGNILTLTCAADGSVTIARSSGTDTFNFSAWMTWI